MTDFATQRKSMVDSQVRPSDVTDRRIPRAMLEVEREAFVPAALRTTAYRDEGLMVAPGRHMLAPRVLAKLIQHLEIGPEDAVLDVGAATGYSTAVLARLAKRVVLLDADQALAEQAHTLLAADKRIKLMLGDHQTGVPADGPYDAILVNGMVADIPAGLLDQLKDGGRLAAILDVAGVGKATLWRRIGMKFDRRTLFDAAAPPLPGFERKAEFVF